MDEFTMFVKSPPKFAIIAALEATLFNKANLAQLRGTGRVNGVLVMPTNLTHIMESPDVTYPNRQYGLYPLSDHQWNPNGTGLSYMNFDYPIFRLKSYHVEQVENASRMNQERNYRFPLRGLKMSASMWAAHNSETCLRRGFCEPLGGQNVYSSLQPLLPEERKKIILITSTLDSSAFFHEDVLGGDAFTASVVASLAVADVLTRSDFSTYRKNVVFSFFNAEAWGFIGSKKWVYDLKPSWECLEIDPNDPYWCLNPKLSMLALQNLSLASLEYIIDLNQVAGFQSPSSLDSTLFLHQDNQLNEQSSQLSDLFLTMARLSNATNLMRKASADPTIGPGLPPGSLMSFLATNRSLAGITISDFKDQFTNPYFFSVYDNAFSIDLDRATTVICQLVNITAKVVDFLATESSLLSSTSNVAPNCTLVSFT
jgi:nicastrin